MSEELRRCPFCGGGRIITSFIRDGRACGCIDCGAFVKAFQPNAEAECRSKWNRRADLTLSPDELRQVKEALEKGKDRTQRWCHTQGNVQAFFDTEIAPINAALAILASKLVEQE